MEIEDEIKLVKDQYQTIMNERLYGNDGKSKFSIK